ncbi:MAG: hypothetical protein ACI9EB_001250 [Pseudomonas sp.]|jgi:hypothetical protein
MGVGKHVGTPPLAYTEQMWAMAVLLEQMLFAKTPDEHSALMATPGDAAARQELMEQRMDMLQSIMQLMMDRMQPVSSAK